MDGRKNNGGNKNAGRKPKADELILIEKLSPLDDLAFEKLRDGVESGLFPYLKLFYEYRYGKPKQMIDVTTNGEQIVNNNISNLTYDQLMALAHGGNKGDNNKRGKKGTSEA